MVTSIFVCCFEFRTVQQWLLMMVELSSVFNNGGSTFRMEYNSWLTSGISSSFKNVKKNLKEKTKSDYKVSEGCLPLIGPTQQSLQVRDEEMSNCELLRMIDGQVIFDFSKMGNDSDTRNFPHIQHAAWKSRPKQPKLGEAQYVQITVTTFEIHTK